jgi:Ca2+-binding EF-hand superfamily protein
MIVAHKSTAEEIGILRKVFQRFDTKKKGQIVFEDFKEGFTAYEFSDDELAHLFKGIVSTTVSLCCVL